MKTVYIDAAALAVLKKTAMDTDYPQTVLRQKPGELRLVLTEQPLEIKLKTEGKRAVFSVSYRTMPLHLTDDCRFSVPLSVLEKLRKQLPLLLEEGKRIACWKSDSPVEKLAVFLTEAFTFWLGDSAFPDCGDGILLLSGDPPELRTVQGDERPELAFFRIDPGSGEPETCFFRLYDETPSMKNAVDFRGGKIISITKTVTDPKTGEKKSVPVFGAEARATQALLALQDEGHNIEENWKGQLVFEEEGAEETLGHDAEARASARLFVSSEDLLKLPTLPFPPRLLPEALRVNFLLELTDAAITARVQTDKEKRRTELTVFRRIAVNMFSPAVARMQYQRANSREFFFGGSLEISGSKINGYIALALAAGYKKLAGLLLAADCADKLQTDTASGILLSVDGETVSIFRVSGTERPALPGFIANTFQISRPYADEKDGQGYRTLLAEIALEALGRTSLAEGVRKEAADDSLETLLEKAARKDPEGLKQLGKRYETGDGVEQDQQKALALYRQAQALLPDDKDLEFDIFMLEMII